MMEEDKTMKNANLQMAKREQVYVYNIEAANGSHTSLAKYTDAKLPQKAECLSRTEISGNDDKRRIKFTVPNVLRSFGIVLTLVVILLIVVHGSKKSIFRIFVLGSNILYLIFQVGEMVLKYMREHMNVSIQFWLCATAIQLFFAYLTIFTNSQSVGATE